MGVIGTHFYCTACVRGCKHPNRHRQAVRMRGVGVPPNTTTTIRTAHNFAPTKSHDREKRQVSRFCRDLCRGRCFASAEPPQKQPPIPSDNSYPRPKFSAFPLPHIAFVRFVFFVLDNSSHLAIYCTHGRKPYHKNPVCWSNK